MINIFYEVLLCTMDSLRKISIKTNYVLIKTEKDIHELKSGLSVQASKENRSRGIANTEARHYNITGEVLAIPEKLVFRGEELKELRDRTGGNYDDYGIKELQSHVNGSIAYDTTIEIKVGDKVWFDYLAHINAYSDQKVLQIEGYGECILVEYTRLFVREREGVKIPINGYIFIKKLKSNQSIGNTGLSLPKNIDTTIKNSAEVVAIGNFLPEYLSVKYTDNHFMDISVGDRICYNQGVATPLEYSIHQSEGLEDMFKIRRSDIHYLIRNGIAILTTEPEVNFKMPLVNLNYN